MTYKDIHLNENGDLEIGYDGDFAVVYDDDVTVENIRFRLQTYKGDYALEPDCGASLEDFIGEPNTKELGVKVEEAVTDALTHDGFLSDSDFTVRVSPLGPAKLLIAVQVDGLRGNFIATYDLDLLTGKLSTI